jgi:uncharacterized protein (DUF433 family)
MPSRTLDEHIEHEHDAAGEKAHIRGRRITVQDVAIWHERLGRSADKIATEHDRCLLAVQDLQQAPLAAWRVLKL